MQMVKKTIVIIFVAWFAILLLMPKEEMYYKMEKFLATQDIKLNEKSIEEGLFSLEVKDITVYVKGIALAHIDEIDFFTLLIYNVFNVNKVIVDEVLQSKLPAKTEKVSFKYTVFSPSSVSIDANGTFGSAEGILTLDEKKLHLDFIETQEIEILKPFLEKNEKGWFYEKSF